ncbi:flagellar biosynthetic protein FliO [Pseudaminobacter soli (ex Li et al. 2025)]|uniref:Flagellar biosynthesis protein FliO n=1 Tax=Pseudaminobacter soli (ex Li et al. 2025) TaxID=1295366 RepID=A0A2P7SND0_9HYPH|nr:flagellar biosynthetic protein FliO [Mesorhizobium soli]PSJ63968.1 hypothetical protein C7I85_02300 [Mesorhizobium soli]
MEWLDSVAGPGYTAALLWTFAALILLVIVLVIIKLFRSLTFGTFVSGGRNRKTRLAVMDAAAVDSHRRLVLVRRDDVEHLLLIGGPTDVVVEQDIRLNQQRRPSLAGELNHEPPARPRALEPQPAPRPAPQPRAPEPAPRPMPVQQPIPAAVPQQPAPMAAPRPAPAPVSAPRPEPRMPVGPAATAPVRQEPVISTPPVQQAPAPIVPSPQRDEVDDSLLRELEISLEETPAQPEPSAPEVSLDDEMTKLLGELSNQKR